MKDPLRHISIIWDGPTIEPNDNLFHSGNRGRCELTVSDDWDTIDAGQSKELANHVLSQSNQEAIVLTAPILDKGDGSEKTTN